MLITESKTFKLGDFGIARQVENTATNLSRKGTTSYMAPELYNNERYSFSVDIYSLGILMYKLLNKDRMPFMPDAPNPIGPQDYDRSLHRRLRGDLIQLPLDAQNKLGEILLKACKYNPRDRYSRPEQMRDELQRYKQGEATILKPKPPRKYCKTFKLIVTIFAVICVLLVLLVLLQKGLMFDSAWKDEEIESGPNISLETPATTIAGDVLSGKASASMEVAIEPTATEMVLLTAINMDGIVAAGTEFTALLKSDGTVVTSGNTSIDTSEWRDIVQIAADGFFAIGLKSDGTLVASGDLLHREGDVSSWRDVVQVACGYRHTIAVTKEGTVYYAGVDSYGSSQCRNWTNVKKS